MGYATYFSMFIKRKKNRSGTVSIVVAEKSSGFYKEFATIGIAKSPDEIDGLLVKARVWIDREEERRHPRLDLFGDERKKCETELLSAEQMLSCITNISINGADLILDRVFDNIGFNRIEDIVFRQLVKARLAYPVSKSATVEYLKNHFDEDVSLSKIYRYLDKLSDNQHEIVQGISVMHTSKILDGHIGVLFYDVTTLYFEADYEDDLRKTGFSKEGRHKNPQIIPGLLVSIGGYPLAYCIYEGVQKGKIPPCRIGYLISVSNRDTNKSRVPNTFWTPSYCIYEGNKYEGHTMLPVVTEFVRKYSLDDFIVVADSGLMNGNNIADLESNGYKYIIGAKIKNESKKIQEWILAQPKVNCQMIEYDKGNGQRLLVGYTDDRARKDAYNREKGIRRLEKAYNRGTLTKDNINKRGYNKFLKMEGDVKVSINYDKLEADEKWDGLKGYLTNTDIPVSEVYAAYHNLGHVERAFRISKSKIEIRPMFHFTRRRIEAHVCICFVALKVYKELERLLKLSNINMSVDKVLALAQTIVTIQVTLPQSKQTITRTMLMKRHQRIAPLFNDGFWGTH